MKCWSWSCDECGTAGIEFSKEAAENMLAAHLCMRTFPSSLPLPAHP
jgi:hypothetical protein